VESLRSIFLEKIDRIPSFDTCPPVEDSIFCGSLFGLAESHRRLYLHDEDSYERRLWPRASSLIIKIPCHFGGVSYKGFKVDLDLEPWDACAGKIISNGGPGNAVLN
jgi:hypothetical protein